MLGWFVRPVPVIRPTTVPIIGEPNTGELTPDPRGRLEAVTLDQPLLTIGQTLTDHDVHLFGDFTWYVSTVVNSPLAQAQHTSVTLTPGIRTHLGNDWYLLVGLPTPLTNERIGSLGMIFWFMKAW
jgi:hypothetical protein